MKINLEVITRSGHTLSYQGVIKLEYGDCEIGKYWYIETYTKTPLAEEGKFSWDRHTTDMVLEIDIKEMNFKTEP